MGSSSAGSRTGTTTPGVDPGRVGQPGGVAVTRVEHAARDRRRPRGPRRVRADPLPRDLPRLQQAVGEQRCGPLVGVRSAGHRVGVEAVALPRARRRASWRPPAAPRHTAPAPRRPAAGGGSPRGRGRPRAARPAPRCPGPRERRARRRRPRREPVRRRASRNRSSRPSHRSSTAIWSGVASHTAWSSTTPGAAASTAGRAPSRARSPAAHTAATPVVRARSTTTGSGAKPQLPPQPGDLRRAAVGAVGEHREPRRRAARRRCRAARRPAGARRPRRPRCRARPRPRARRRPAGPLPDTGRPDARRRATRPPTLLPPGIPRSHACESRRACQVPDHRCGGPPRLEPCYPARSTGSTAGSCSSTRPRCPAIRTVAVDDVDALVDAIRRLVVRGAPALGVAGRVGRGAGRPPRRRPRRGGRPHRHRPAHRRQPRRRRPPRARRRRRDPTPCSPRRLARAGRGRRGLPRHRRPRRRAARRPVRPGRRCGCRRTATRARWPASSGARRWAWCGRCTPRAGWRWSWPTRRARSCRAPGSPRSNWRRWASPHRVVVDGAGPSVIARGLVDAVVVGADRVAANGDVANKIGTYPLALAAAPRRASRSSWPARSPRWTSTRRTARRSRSRTAPRTRCSRAARAWNPAFDVTPADLVTAIVTETRVWS